MSVWDRFTSFWRHVEVTDRSPVWFVPLGKDQILDPDLKAVAGTELRPGVHYVTVAVRRMNLRTDQFVGKNKFPVIHSQIVLNVGGSKLTFPAVAGQDKVGQVDLSTGDGASTSYQLMPTRPLQGDTLELVAGVVSMNAANDAVTRLTKVVGQITDKLLPASLGIGATVNTAIGLTTTALDCVDELFGHADAEVVLAMHALFSGEVGERLRTGLYALVDTQPLDHPPVAPAQLRFRNDELLFSKADGKVVDLRDCDWMVLEIGGTTHRSYRDLPQIRELMSRAVKELAKNPQEAVALRNAAVAELYGSTDIADADRVANYRKIVEDFDDVAAASGIGLTSPTAGPVKSDRDTGSLAGATEPGLADLMVAYAG